ncbi:MAG: nucleotide exchange factor GrpE [bacterium]
MTEEHQPVQPDVGLDNIENGGDDSEELEARLKLAEETAEGYLAQLTRLQADFVNFRRRIERERSEQIKYANEQLLHNMLPVVDNLQRALDAGKGEGSLEAMMEGVAQVLKQFLMVLEKEGAVPLDPGIGEPFDPEHQEALMREEGEAEVVVEELLTGWRYRDRVLRPTLVKVGPKTKDPEGEVEPETLDDENE